MASVSMVRVPAPVRRFFDDEDGGVDVVVAAVVGLVMEVDCGRSLLCQLIWIMGANRLKAVMDALLSGTV